MIRLASILFVSEGTVSETDREIADDDAIKSVALGSISKHVRANEVRGITFNSLGSLPPRILPARCSRQSAQWTRGPSGQTVRHRLAPTKDTVQEPGGMNICCNCDSHCHGRSFSIDGSSHIAVTYQASFDLALFFP